MNVFERVLELQNSGHDGVLVTVVEKEGSGPLPAGARMLVYPDGHTTGTVGGGALELIATRRAIELLGQRASLLAHYRLGEQNEILEGEATGMMCGGRVSLFYEYLRARPRLYLAPQVVVRNTNAGLLVHVPSVPRAIESARPSAAPDIGRAQEAGGCAHDAPTGSGRNRNGHCHCLGSGWGAPTTGGPLPACCRSRGGSGHLGLRGGPPNGNGTGQYDVHPRRNQGRIG